jgi:ribosome maturation factor RimP
MDRITHESGELEQRIEARVAALDPDLELIALQRPRSETLRIFIDHPGGVTLEHCERVTKALDDLTVDWALEVSSPGLDRPLTKPSHYERFVGHEIRVQTNEPIGGQRNFKGRLAAAGPEAISLDSGDGLTEIPLDRVHRSNLVPQLSEVHQ